MNYLQKKIFIYFYFSGYVSTASTAAVITNSIYSLDPIGFHWKRQTSSSSYRYLHSAVASSGIFFKNYSFYYLLVSQFQKVFLVPSKIQKKD